MQGIGMGLRGIWVRMRGMGLGMRKICVEIQRMWRIET